MRAAPKLLFLIIAGAVAFPPAQISAKEHRSREVTREVPTGASLPFDWANKRPLSRRLEGPPTSCRSPAADLTRFPIHKGWLLAGLALKLTRPKLVQSSL